MSEYLWHHTTGDVGRYVLVVILAWHETTATVLPLDENEDRRPGTIPYLVALGALRFGRPADGVVIAA